MVPPKNPRVAPSWALILPPWSSHGPHRLSPRKSCLEWYSHYRAIALGRTHTAELSQTEVSTEKFISPLFINHSNTQKHETQMLCSKCSASKLNRILRILIKIFIPFSVNCVLFKAATPILTGGVNKDIVYVANYFFQIQKNSKFPKWSRVRDWWHEVPFQSSISVSGDRGVESWPPILLLLCFRVYH